MVSGGDTRGGRPASAMTAVVIGAGVSGCACAAALVERGVRVQLVNSALDRVAHPGCGPDVIAEGGWAGVVEVLAGLSRVVRDVWVEAAVCPPGGGAVVAVDRRRISIELKRALELLPGLEFRQGLVNDVRLTGTGGGAAGLGWEQRTIGVAVETVFGEVFEAEAAVVAVGLALGGMVVTGEDVLPGGRYGETRAEGLLGALERLGARMSEEEIRVGPRFLMKSFGEGGLRGVAESVMSAGVARAQGYLRGVAPLSESLRVDEGAYEGSGGWPEEFPPAPHWARELQPVELYAATPDNLEGQWLVLPDGCALGEVYVLPAPGPSFERDPCADMRDGRGLPIVASRLGQKVSALVVTGLGRAGRLRAESGGDLPVWVTGRASGSTDYLGSLRAGTLTGIAVAEALGAQSVGAR